jgi:myo-inositol-1(or 4)-monophosphatase
MTDPSPAAVPSPGELLSVAVEVVRSAATLIPEVAHPAGGVRAAAVPLISTKSSATDLVTEVDRAVGRRIVEELARRRPGDGLNGEEGAARPGSTGVTWHIDPIDGTTNFVYGLPGYAVSVAAEHGAQMVAGVVLDVVRDELFTATVGGGAARNGAPIRCSSAADVSTALVATGFSYLAERRARQARVLETVLPAVRDIRRLGAASTDLCAVACGHVDAFYEKGLGSWDYAAGALVATEAGAMVGGLDGGPPSGDFVLASSPALFGPLRTLLARSGAGDA